MNSLNNISLTLEYKKGKSPSPKKIRETLSPIMNNSNMSGKSVNDISKNINKKNNENKENKEKEDKNKNKKNSYKDINTSPFLKAKQPAKSNKNNYNGVLNSSKIDKKKDNNNNKKKKKKKKKDSKKN